MLSRRGVQLIPLAKRFVRFGSTEAYSNALVSLKQDLKRAMLAKDNIKKTTIRNMLSTIKNKEIDNKDKNFDEFVLHDIYSKLISQRKDSIADFLKNDREDLVGKEEAELNIIKSYLEVLPVVSTDELDSKVSQLLQALKREKGDSLQMSKIFSEIDWNTTTIEWKASSSMIKSSIVSQYKNVF